MRNREIKLFAFSLLFLFFCVISIHIVNAESLDLNVSTDREIYKTGDEVTITAELENAINITFEVDEPDDNILLILTKNTTEEDKAILKFNLTENASIGEYFVWIIGKTEIEVCIKSIKFNVTSVIPPLL